MILNREPLSISEATEYIEKENEIAGFIKKFSKIKSKEAKELRKKIEELNLIKVKSEDIVKIIDILPEDTGELNKIFNDVSLDENETKKILETIKEFK